MVNSVEAVLQARKVYKDLHQAYDYEKVIQVLKDWLEENKTLAYEHNLAIEELGWLYGSSIISESLYQIHKVIKEDNLGEDIEDIRIKPEPIPSENIPSAIFSNEDFEPEPEEDVVNHPKHYQLANGLEAIELMELTSTAPEFVGHLRNTALKYIIRAGHKDPSKYVQDLDKAKWYITKLQEFHTKCEDKEY
jgi:hypothetical protein